MNPRPWEERVANFLISDISDPKRQTEQILAIYPILSGQKTTGVHPIPSRPTTSSTAPAAAPAESHHNDLIDFGETDAPSQLEKPVAPHVESTGEISGLLKSTGKPSEGPLIDFHNDLKNHVPSIARTDTTHSNDIFVDAKE